MDIKGISIPLIVLLELDNKYREVIPSPNDSIETIMYRAGQRQVIKELLDTYDPTGNRHAYK